MSKTRRKGRGRLSSIDLLPAEAGETVAWAAQALRERERTQTDIHTEFNERLTEIGLEPVSASAFNRHAIRLAETLRRVQQTREIAAVLTDKLPPGQSDDVTITLAEMIKSLVFELLEAGGDAGLTPKQAMEMATAVKSIVAAEKMSLDRRRKLEAAVEDKVDEAIEQVSQEAGLSAERVAQIRRDVLGVR